jgi:hypothetical protein
MQRQEWRDLGLGDRAAASDCCLHALGSILCID